MAPLAVTGRRLHPRDSFPSALSVLSTAFPGSLEVPGMLQYLPRKEACSGPPRISSTLVVSLSHYFRPPTDGTSGRSGSASSPR
ncbi:hypothetical protein DPMN_044741 [Dreissena polymorpha]|uniref:Uncharacterized protein n=1 Tax=Dreissena polymorpha TaxID=45954 RepID=A0A9D4HWQ1_DREPO|nr:hypothetical protein DPMN_044741 [Dreissena polymorpha]